MTNKKLFGMLSLLFVVLIYISACENPSNTFEESVEPYMELQAIEEASNTTVNVNRGEAAGFDSYFAFDFSNIENNGIVSEGLVEGWCLEWNKAIRQNNDTHSGVKMYNTFGSDNWKSANYLMNIRKDLKAADPDLTYREIQVALWSLIKTPRFDLDEVLKEGNMPSRMMRDGQPNFSVEKVKKIVNKVRSNSDQFEYKPGTPVIVFSQTDDDQQNVGGVFGETAWAVKTITSDGNTEVNSDYSTCHTDLADLDGNNWGWSNGKYSDGDDDTFDVYAGAGQCDLDKGTYIGTFSFTYVDGELNYTLDLEVDNALAELHLFAGNTLLPVKNGNGSYTNAPGQLGNKVELDGGIKEYTGKVDGLSGDIYIAVHLGE